MKIKKIIKRYKAVSQVIAILLLIGLTVLAGAALFVVILPLLSTDNDVLLETSDNVVFSTTEKTQLDPFIDTMKIQVSNIIDEPVELDLAHSYLYNVSNNQILYQWTSQLNNSKPTLSGKQGISLEFRTAADQNIEELLYGQKVFVEFNASLFNSQKTKLIRSQIYTVSSANSLPIFDISPVNHYSQSGSTVFFEALPNQTVTTNLSLSVWNKGNSAESYQKTIEIFLENDTYFEIDPKYKKQTITIPASANIGEGGVCTTGSPCINVDFPITRINLIDLGINGINATYGAQIYLSGSNFYPYTLNITSPRLVSLILPDSLIAKGTGNGRIANSNLIYNGPFNSENSLDLEIIIWNGDSEPLDANIFIKNFNTTAFRLDSSNLTSIFIPNGILPASLDVCNPSDPCAVVTWTITRLPLKIGNQDTGIISGAYNIELSFLEFGTSLPVVLFINGPGSEASPYMYINSVSWTKNTNKNELSSIVEIYDANFNTISGASVSAQWKKPDGSITSLVGITSNKGLAVFTQTSSIGLHTLTVQNVQKDGNIYDPTRNKITNNQSTYTVNSNYIYVNSLSWTYTVASKSKPTILEVLIVVNDQANNPISGVSTFVVWQNPSLVNTSMFGTTGNIQGTQGAVKFTVSSPASGNHVIFMENLVLNSYDYDQSANKITFPSSFTSPLLKNSVIDNQDKNYQLFNNQENVDLITESYIKYEYEFNESLVISLSSIIFFLV